MPVVYPSQVVDFIDRLIKTGAIVIEHENIRFDVNNALQLEAIVSLVDGVPNHVLQLDPQQYSGLVVAVTTIRGALANFRSGYPAQLDAINAFRNRNSVTIIREALAACPDSVPAPDTNELGFIPDSDFRESLRQDHSDANRALVEGEWKAATVLAGSVVEALLLWALDRRKPEAVTAGAALKNPANEAGLEWWKLHEFIEVAVELKVITEETAQQARLAKNFRNLIHPGRAIRRKQICDRATALSAVAAVEHVIRDLSRTQADTVAK